MQQWSVLALVQFYFKLFYLKKGWYFKKSHDHAGYKLHIHETSKKQTQSTFERLTRILYKSRFKCMQIYVHITTDSSMCLLRQWLFFLISFVMKPTYKTIHCTIHYVDQHIIIYINSFNPLPPKSQTNPGFKGRIERQKK